MLKRLAHGEKRNTPCVLLLGGFDGMHLGHKRLFKVAQKYGCDIGLTSIYGGKGRDIFTPQERAIVYERMGLDFCYELPFSDKLRNTSAEDFLRELEENFHLVAVVCGSDFRFGRNATGTPELLKKLASCPVEAVDLKKVDGEKVASSTVKEYLSKGGMSEANTLLTHPYFIHGWVEHGRKVGHAMGFPTVNLAFPNEKYPLRQGVYGGQVRVEGNTYPSVIHFGARPTFGVAEQKVEAFLDGFHGDLYGKEIEVYPKEFYREVKAFSSQEELTEQIERDLRRLRND